LPDELQDINSILTLINKGENNTGLLTNSIKTLKPDITDNQIATYLTGQLNRINDLDLVDRRYDGLSYIYEVTKKGNKILMSVNEG
jgi:hypothetical protein